MKPTDKKLETAQALADGLYAASSPYVSVSREQLRDLLTLIVPKSEAHDTKQPPAKTA